jgi:hypothetical protein
MSQEDWDKISPDIQFIYNQDSYFSELKQTEIFKDRLDILTQMEEYVGKYYSVDWVRKNILQQSEEEIIKIDEQIQKEGSNLESEEEVQEGEY